jgi:radical SAM protein with 4Fe4S-binding SPASM domain
MITFSRFNEPTYNIDLLNKRIKQTKQILPYIETIVNTNGDYLTKENLNKINLKLDKIDIMDYDCLGVKKIIDKIDQCNIKINNIDENQKIIKGTYKNNITVSYHINWPKNNKLEDRGGLLEGNIYHNNIKLQWKKRKKEREKPCLIPTKYLTINYKGNITPCCHIRSDHNKHKEYILGNVKQQSLVDIYHSNKAKKIRESAKKGSFKEHNLEPCLYCQKYNRYI